MGKNKTQNDARLFDALAKLGSVAVGITKEALKRVPIKDFNFWILLASTAFLVYSAGYNFIHLRIANFFLPDLFDAKVISFFKSLGNQFHAWSGVLSLLSFLSIYYGGKSYLKRKRLQEQLELIDLKNAKGKLATITRVVEPDSFRKKLIIFAPGIGKERFETKRSDLQAAFGSIVERIDHGKNPAIITIDLTSKSLPSLCNYEMLANSTSTPYSFVVGESLAGIETKCIRELPHLLIAGTTGGGKSVFFKQALLALLEKSDNIQMFLLDLKSGVEMKEFADLPNVQVAKTESEAISLLRTVNNEMKRRFTYLENKGFKSIDPKRDKKDIIIVGTDEASVLYGISKGARSENQMAETARKLTDNLAKLSRAAGIHLIFATQKVTQASIDTKVQENLEGRMIFRMNTLQGSLTTLGNKSAMELPDIRGRAIWSCGNKRITVQAPYLSQECLEERLEVLNAKWKKGEKKMFQSNLIKTSAPKLDAALETN